MQWSHVFDDLNLTTVIEQAKQAMAADRVATPKLVLLGSEKVLTTIVDVPSSEVKLTDEQLQNMLQWELEPLVAQRMLINRFGMEMVYEGLLSMDQVREVLLRQQQLKQEAEDHGLVSGGDQRFGQVAIRMGYLKPNQLNAFLESYDSSVQQDMALNMNWETLDVSGDNASMATESIRLIASAVPTELINKWRAECNQAGLKLVGIGSSCHVMAKALLAMYPQQQRVAVTTQQTRYQLQEVNGLPESILQQGLVAFQADHPSRLHELGMGQQPVNLDLTEMKPGLYTVGETSGNPEFKHMEPEEVAAFISSTASFFMAGLWGINDSYMAAVSAIVRKPNKNRQPMLVHAGLVLMLLLGIGGAEYRLQGALRDANKTYTAAQSDMKDKQLLSFQSQQMGPLIKDQEDELAELNLNLTNLEKQLAFSEERSGQYQSMLQMLLVIKNAANKYQVVLDLVGHERTRLVVKGWVMNEFNGRRLIQTLAGPAQSHGFYIKKTSITQSPDGRLGRNSHAIEIEFGVMDRDSPQESETNKELDDARMVER